MTFIYVNIDRRLCLQIHDVILFVTILGVCLVGYGVAIQAILFPFEEPSWDLLLNVVYVPFWQIHGELFLDRFRGTTE